MADRDERRPRSRHWIAVLSQREDGDRKRSKRASSHFFRKKHGAATRPFLFRRGWLTTRCRSLSRRNLTRRFGTFTAVNNVSFAIKRGEIFGFPRVEWLRQDDHDENADGPPSRQRRRSASVWQAQSMLQICAQGFASAICRNPFRLYRIDRKAEILAFTLICFISASTPMSALRACRPLRACPLSRSARCRPSAWHSSAPFAGRRHRPQARNPHPRRADIRRRSAGARRLLGSPGRPFTQRWYDDLHLDTFHERGCPLRSYRIDERGTRSRDGNTGGTDQGPSIF